MGRAAASGGANTVKYLKVPILEVFKNGTFIVVSTTGALRIGAIREPSYHGSGSLHPLPPHPLSIPDNCYGHHGQCPCKNILSGVKFSRLNTKTAYILLFRGIFECFGAVLVNFWV